MVSPPLPSVSPVYYRALVNFTYSLVYSPELEDIFSPAFMEISDAVVDTVIGINKIKICSNIYCPRGNVSRSQVLKDVLVVRGRASAYSQRHGFKTGSEPLLHVVPKML